MQEDNLLSLSYGRIIRKSIDAAEGLLPESFETYQIVEPGNIVMRLTDLQNDKRSLRQGLVKERGIITSAYDVLELEKGHDPRFWAYALLALDLAKYYYSMGGGVRQSIKFSDFPNDWISTPETETQKAIADFLDRETVRIDELVEKKKRLLSVLAQKRSAIISRAVSGDVAGRSKEDMRETGNTWFPEIPKNWAFTKFSRVAFYQEGPGLRYWQFTEDGVRVICVTNITESGVDFSRYQKFISFEEYQKTYKHFTVKPGDLLLSSSGNSWGKVAEYIDGPETILNTSTIRINPGNLGQSTTGFIALLLRSQGVREQLDLLMTGSCQPNFGPTHLSKIWVPLPPLEQQQEIVETITGDLKKGYGLTSTIEQSISRLQEFRSALITAAVTGQIDVTTWGKQGTTDRRLDEIEEAMRA
jgi:type I restriction enzyme S subunit